MIGFEQLRAGTPPSIAEIITQPEWRMIDVLEEVEKLLPKLLDEAGRWRSVVIGKPRLLLRVFRPLGDIKVNLHHFTAPANDDCACVMESSYHPHAWAAGMKILHGEYDQWVGLASAPGHDCPPPKTRLIRQGPGDVYMMEDPLMWHQVIPCTPQGVTTLMVTCRPAGWSQALSRENILKFFATEADVMLKRFRAHYPRQPQRQAAAMPVPA